MNRCIIFTALVLLCVPIHNSEVVGVTQLSEEQVQAFRSAKTVRIVDNMFIDSIDFVNKWLETQKKDRRSYQTNLFEGRLSLMHLGERFKPFVRATLDLLKYAKVKVVGVDDKNYDTTLRIEGYVMLSNFGLRAPLLFPTFCYYKANLSGTISLEVAGIPRYVKGFYGEGSGGWSSASPSAFDMAFVAPDSFLPTIVETLGEIYGANFLIAALKDKDSDIRRGVLNSLGKIKDPLTVEALIAALKDEDSSVRMSTAITLGKIKDPRFVELLIVFLKDKDDSVSYWAVDALEKITKQDFGKDVIKWQEWWEKSKDNLLKTK